MDVLNQWAQPCGLPSRMRSTSCASILNRDEYTAGTTTMKIRTTPAISSAQPRAWSATLSAPTVVMVAATRDFIPVSLADRPMPRFSLRLPTLCECGMPCQVESWPGLTDTSVSGHARPAAQGRLIAAHARRRETGLSARPGAYERPELGQLGPDSGRPSSGRFNLGKSRLSRRVTRWGCDGLV